MRTWNGTPLPIPVQRVNIRMSLSLIDAVRQDHLALYAEGCANSLRHCIATSVKETVQLYQSEAKEPPAMVLIFVTKPFEASSMANPTTMNTDYYISGNIAVGAFEHFVDGSECWDPVPSFQFEQKAVRADPSIIGGHTPLAVFSAAADYVV